MKQHLDKATVEMKKVIDKFEHHLGTVRTGRANPKQLEDIHVDYYGSATPLSQVGSIQVVEGRQLVIKPYDTSLLKLIEHAIQAANLGMNPMNDGTVVRINVPALTEQTRKEITKVVEKHAEEAKVSIRNVRRDVNDAIKKDDTLTEDREKDALEKIQKLTDEHIKKIETIVKDKEKDIMTV
ncbi:MAG: ribosome recycling factor [Erysipelotrichaceae bacterium]|nr:MAG: ribosome recycling [Erysipelotrichaceae bacterium]TXT19412.1 MAG: ribosome recycling factor [Erysipelotrichaceae bacterium]